ncbi:diguanylate cyclase domain protein [Yersinia rohdei]|uniref:diguanylate cyclase n=1 Tax=Yersinia rohdei TaxID=29485 RepID=A0A0U1HXY0_YERRO|nr:EAL domain-containing protein [Yersinia rohdei]AJJ11858.1 diguanylate cyclase domain protein [Yersinia rohdei]EEQ00985.1 Sensory box-containing diguanylate cyclase [Yersinia rohdei ATCC 43380]MDN0096778.1 EAL domain-containing protein [Yersinia rohdei]CNE56968.1 sensory box-containing diguanylate cyclase [Yersinia rohdei]CQI97362.1 sensory box-containing diguanylate cyclase [Yersinia rohdei]
MTGSNSQASQVKGENVFFAKQTLQAMALLVGATIIIAAVGIIYIASQLNEQAINQSRFLVEKAWEMRKNSISSRMKDNAFWGDAYEHLHVKVDTDWAFVSQNMGSSLYNNFNYEGVFVIDGEGKTRYSVINGQLVQTSLQDWLHKSITPLIDAARARAANEYIATSTIEVAGQPVIIAAAALTTGSDPLAKAVAGAPSVLVFIDSLTPAELNALGEDYGIHQLRIPRDPKDNFSKPSVSLSSSDGSHLTLHWNQNMPGAQLLNILLPLLMLVAIILGLTGWLVLRRTMSEARIADKNKAALMASEERFRHVAESATDWLWETDADLRITYLSQRFLTITGLAAEQWLGRKLDSLLNCDIIPLRSWLQYTHQTESRNELQCTYLSAKGDKRICRIYAKPIIKDGETVGFRGTASDITREIKAQERIQHLSLHDALTGLPNRLRMKQFLENKLLNLAGTSHPLVILNVDLDKFKPVNDTFGHVTGDLVLHQVSERLRGCLRDQDLVARQGGDEFILIITGLSSIQEIEQLCARVIAQIESPYIINEQDIYIGASIGIALAPQDSIHAEELLRFADIAMYEAKNSGRNRWSFYSSEMNDRLMQRSELERFLRQAIKHNEFCLYYQPRYRIEGTQLTGAEALVRWNHPVLGLLMPDQFIALAEETGLITSISDWTMLQACQDATTWPQSLIVSVNISAIEFRNQRLIERVRQVLLLTGLPSHRLELEITERIMIEDADGAFKTMMALKTLGVRLSMDDFGTGYSSLNYLRRFPFDGLKIDKSFTDELAESPEGLSIVEGIINLGHALSMTVTAEGVETEEQLTCLQTLMCDEVQGYFLGKPMKLDDLSMLIRSANYD